MIRKIGLSVLAIIAVFLGYVGLRSPNYAVSREIAINAPAEKIFPYLNNPKLSEQWGPWHVVDPEIKMTYSGPDAGVGSRSSWEDSKHLGTGSATIVESVPSQRVGIKLEYIKPMSMVQDAEYSIRQLGNQSVVTWSARGKNNFMMRLMCVFVNIDKHTGGFFEMGLSKLKMLVEKSG